MRKQIILILVSCIFIMYGYENTTSNLDFAASTYRNIELHHKKESEYNTNSETFKYIDESKQIKVIINYPKIIDLGNTASQIKINKLIKDAALEPYYDFLDTEGSITEGTEWPVEYSIVYANSNIISVKFEGYVYKSGNAHGINLVYTINININSCEIIVIDDLFGESFRYKINHKYFKGLDVDTTNSNTIDEIFDRFRNDFINSYNNFYFSSDKFIIILPIDDFYQFSVNYDDLIDCMKLDYLVWSEILNQKK